MILKGLIDEDFVNYKKSAMFLIFPWCDFKCEKDCGIQCCQNSSLANQPTCEIPVENIVERYITNPITHSIVIGGMEPFCSWKDLQDLIQSLREKTEDDIVIYTGYYENEITNQIEQLKQYKNIIVKFGRFIPNRPHKKDDVLGVTLASDNQFAVKIS